MYSDNVLFDYSTIRCFGDKGCCLVEVVAVDAKEKSNFTMGWF